MELLRTLVRGLAGALVLCIYMCPFFDLLLVLDLISLLIDY